MDEEKKTTTEHQSNTIVMTIDFRLVPKLRVVQERIIRESFKDLGCCAIRLVCAAGFCSAGSHHNPVHQETLLLLHVIIKVKNKGEHLEEIQSSPEDEVQTLGSWIMVHTVDL